MSEVVALKEAVKAVERLEVSHDAWKVRAEKAEKERDEAKATLETYRSVAGVAERTAEELRERLLEVEKELDAAIRERDDAQAALARVLPRSCGACEGPLTCARCTVSDQVLAEAERLGARSIDH